MVENPKLFESRNTAEFGVIESAITLRDLFAMAAMHALLRNLSDDIARRAKPPNVALPELAYQTADAMLNERAK